MSFSFQSLFFFLFKFDASLLLGVKEIIRYFAGEV